MVFLLTPVISYAAYPAYEGKWGYPESKTPKSKKSNATAGLSDLPPLFVEEVSPAELNALAVEAQEPAVQENPAVVEMEVAAESGLVDEALAVSFPAPAEQESEVAQNEELEEQEAFLARIEEFVALEEQEFQAAPNEPNGVVSEVENFAALEDDLDDFLRMQQMLAGYEEASPRDFIGQSDDQQSPHANPEKSTRTKRYSPRVREPLVRHRENASEEGAGSSSFSELGEEFENAKRPSITHRSGSYENANTSTAPFADALSNESHIESDSTNLNSEANEALEGAQRPTITHRKSVSSQSDEALPSSDAHSVAVQEDDARSTQEKPYKTPTYTPPHYQAPPDPRTKSQREAPETPAPTVPKPETPKVPEVQKGDQLEQGQGSSSEYGQRMHPLEERKNPTPEKGAQGAQNSGRVEQKQKAPVTKKQTPQQQTPQQRPKQAPSNQSKQQKALTPKNQAPVVDNAEVQQQKTPIAEKKSQRYQRRQVKEKSIAKNESDQKKKHDSDKNSRKSKKGSSDDKKAKQKKKKSSSVYAGKRPSNR